jgi:hypothetical protein
MQLFWWWKFVGENAQGCCSVGFLHIALTQPWVDFAHLSQVGKSDELWHRTRVDAVTCVSFSSAEMSVWSGTVWLGGTAVTSPQQYEENVKNSRLPEDDWSVEVPNGQCIN